MRDKQNRNIERHPGGDSHETHLGTDPGNGVDRGTGSASERAGAGGRAQRGKRLRGICALQPSLLAALGSGTRKSFLRIATCLTGTGWWSRRLRSARWHLTSRAGPGGRTGSKGCRGPDPENRPRPVRSTAPKVRSPEDLSGCRPGDRTAPEWVAVLAGNRRSPAVFAGPDATGAMGTAMVVVLMAPSIMVAPTRDTTGATEPIGNLPGSSIGPVRRPSADGRGRSACIPQEV